MNSNENRILARFRTRWDHPMFAHDMQIAAEQYCESLIGTASWQWDTYTPAERLHAYKVFRKLIGRNDGLADWERELLLGITTHLPGTVR